MLQENMSSVSLQASDGGENCVSVVDLLFQPDKCLVSKAVFHLMDLVHRALKVCWLYYYKTILFSLHKETRSIILANY